MQFTEKIIKAEPAKYPKTSVAEAQAKATFEYIICLKNVKPYLNEMDKIPNALGLKIKDEYSVDEIKSAFIYYLPIWIVEALKIKKILLGYQGFIDPDLILSQLLDSEREEISGKVKERLSKKDYNKEIFPVGNTKYSFGLLVDVLDYLKTVGSHE